MMISYELFTEHVMNPIGFTLITAIISVWLGGPTG